MTVETKFNIGQKVYVAQPTGEVTGPCEITSVHIGIAKARTDLGYYLVRKAEGDIPRQYLIGLAEENLRTSKKAARRRAQHRLREQV